jgi:hypothetical protein
VSWESTQAVILHSRSKKSARTVMLVLAFHAQADGSGARLHMATLGAEVGLKERQLRNVLHELEALGELRWKRGRGHGGKYGRGEGSPSEFNILLPHSRVDREPVVLHRTGNPASSNRQYIAASNSPEPSIEAAISDRRTGNFPSSKRQFSALPLKEDEQDEKREGVLEEERVKATARDAPQPLVPVPKPATSAQAPKPVPFPEQFALTVELETWAREEGISELLDLAKHHRHFVEYWTEGEGQGIRKKNWVLTWKSWMRREVERSPRQRRNGGTGGGRGSNEHAEREARAPGGQRGVNQRAAAGRRIFGELAAEAVDLAKGAHNNGALGPGPDTS